MMRKVVAALVVSVVSIGGFTQGAWAQEEGPGPVEQCLRTINSARAQTVQALNEGARQGVHTIARLDADGADNETLARAAAHAIEGLGTARETGVEAVNGIARRCVDLLASHDAPMPALRVINQARERAIGAINSQFRESAAAVKRALRRAVANEISEEAPEVETTDVLIG